MAWIKKSDYVRENRKTRPTNGRVSNKPLPKYTTKGKNPNWSIVSARLIWCPKLCQQKSNGNYGRKTYDPVTKHCYGCDCEF